MTLTETQVIETAAAPVEVAVAGSGATVLSLHGTPGGAGQGMAFAAHFRNAGLRVIAPSRPGYGETPLDAGESFEEQADLMAALLDALEVERAAVYGLSGGGPTTLQIALRHPDRAACVILEDAISATTRETLAMRIEDNVMMSQPVLALFGKEAENDPVSAIGGMLKSTSTLDHDRVSEIAESIADRERDWVAELAPNLAAKHHHSGHRHDMRQITSLPEYPLEEIAAPTLVCHGDADSEVPLEESRQAADRIPGAELYVVPEAGHMPGLSEHAGELRERQIAFVREHLGEAER